MSRPLTVNPEDFPLPDRYRRARLNAGFKSTAEFALRGGFSKSTVCNVEAGRHEPSRLVTEKWAALTGKSIEWLTTGSDGTEGQVTTGTAWMERRLLNSYLAPLEPLPAAA